jgi:hypothetical protein
MDHDNRHKRRSGVLGSEPDDLGDFCADKSAPDSLTPDALDAPSAQLGAEVLSENKKHARGRPPGHSTHRLDGGMKRAAHKEAQRERRAQAAAVKVRAQLHHFPFTT